MVLLALAGQPAAHGPLQRLLEEAGVPYTGSGHLAAETCADKAMLIEQLIDLSTSGISTAPQQKISLPELSAQVRLLLPALAPAMPSCATLLLDVLTPCSPPRGVQCVDEATADRLFEQLRSSLGAGPVSLCIKPAHACNGLGVMRATGGRDLMAYAQVGGSCKGVCVCVWGGGGGGRQEGRELWCRELGSEADTSLCCAHARVVLSCAGAHAGGGGMGGCDAWRGAGRQP